MKRLISFVATSYLAIAALGCGGSAPSASPPTAQATHAPTPTPTQSATTEKPTQPAATEKPTQPASVKPTQAQTATAPALTLLPGEPWLTYEWFPKDSQAKAVFVARPDGSDQTLIAADAPGMEHRGPTWSPDGLKIAFISLDQPANIGTIYIWDAATRQSSKLFDPGKDCAAGGAFWPSWSPDGKQIAFVCYPSNEQIAVVDVATGVVRPLISVETPDHFDNPPTWSPDGKWIVFDDQHWGASGETLDGTRLGKIPAAGGQVEWLTDYGSFSAWADWHPTEDLISYNTFDLGQMHEVNHPSDIFTMRSDGSHVVQLTDTVVPASVRVAQARWSSDGSQLVASCAEGNPVFIVRVCFVSPTDGTITRPEQEIDGARPELRPTP